VSFDAGGERLRVGILGPSGYGGSTTSACELALGLAQAGQRVHYFSQETPPLLRCLPAGGDARINVHLVSSATVPPLGTTEPVAALAGAVQRLLPGLRLDLLHAHYALPWGLAATLAAKSSPGSQGSIPVILSLHGTDVTQLAQDDDYGPLLGWLARESLALTAPSESLARDAARALGRRPHVLPGCVDMLRFRPGPPRDGPLRVAHVGSMQPWRRVPWLMEAFGEAVRGAPEAGRGARLVLVGDGPERERCQELAHSPELRGRVLLVGTTDDPAPWLRSCDLYASAAREEAFGLALLEGLASGLQVVATRVGGVPELLGDGPWATLVDAGDRPAFVRALRERLGPEARSPDLRAAARARARGYDRGRATRRALALYAHTLEQARAARTT